MNLKYKTNIRNIYAGINEFKKVSDNDVNHTHIHIFWMSLLFCPQAWHLSWEASVDGRYWVSMQ